ncbi:HPr family phosphocarrier protein [Heyndrickxia acidiproducens]|uniref:HPr family phosphocarrier protein n=1 Tax=Heyndrickxia acidiproducens TaxID=1121084 RepID=UPI0003827F72|nr:HPr family phosphocarrier protein [Heyndrickxia acidiproducens]
MIEKQIEVKLKTGLQARPASRFVQEATRFASEIYLEKDGKRVNAKSIMGLMSLAAGCGEKVVLSVDGSDEEEAFEQLSKYIENQ